MPHDANSDFTKLQKWQETNENKKNSARSKPAGMDGTTRANDEGSSRFSTNVAMDADRAGDVNTERDTLVHT
jgi:hypothetical protein